jgi:hypothetical protein
MMRIKCVGCLFFCCFVLFVFLFTKLWNMTVYDVLLYITHHLVMIQRAIEGSKRKHSLETNG